MLFWPTEEGKRRDWTDGLIDPAAAVATADDDDDAAIVSPPIAAAEMPLLDAPYG